MRHRESAAALGLDLGRLDLGRSAGSGETLGSGTGWQVDLMKKYNDDEETTQTDGCPDRFQAAIGSRQTGPRHAP